MHNPVTWYGLITVVKPVMYSIGYNVGRNRALIKTLTLACGLYVMGNEVDKFEMKKELKKTQLKVNQLTQAIEGASYDK